MTSSQPCVFLFTGQGAQFPCMGQAMLDQVPAFKEALHACDEAMAPHFEELGLMDVLYGHPDTDGTPHPIHQTQYTQPALFAIEYAMASALRDHGIEPDVCLGHSVGELAAATFTGMMSLDDGCALICARGRLMQSLPQGGGMAALMCDAETARMLCHAETVHPRCELAGLNGPKQTVISGHLASIEACLERAKAAGVRGKALVVSHAFHSSLMDPILDTFEALAARLTYHAPTVPVVSNLHAEWMDVAPSAHYWRQHIRQPVRFTEGIDCLLTNNALGTCVEVGPQPILSGMAARCLSADERNDVTWVACSDKLSAHSLDAWEHALQTLQSADPHEA